MVRMGGDSARLVLRRCHRLAGVGDSLGHHEQRHHCWLGTSTSGAITQLSRDFRMDHPGLGPWPVVSGQLPVVVCCRGWTRHSGAAAPGCFGVQTPPAVGRLSPGRPQAPMARLGQYAAEVPGQCTRHRFGVLDCVTPFNRSLVSPF